MSFISVENIQHRYGERLALDEVTFELTTGECVVLVGPSGCGKTTLLRLMSGLTPLQHGQILIGGQQPEAGRDSAMIFQTPRLLPWRRARQNIELVLRHLPRAERSSRANHLLRILGLDDAHDLWPQQLSGGMQQRLVLARALAIDAPLLLLDEPFANLDPLAREEMQEALITNTEQRTTILATHSVDEALAVADRIILLHRRPGRVAGVFTPELSGRGMARRKNPRFYNALQMLSETLRTIAVANE